MPETTTAPAAASEPQPASPFNPGPAVGKVAALMDPEYSHRPDALSRGDVAELRRLGPDTMLTSTFWRVLAHVGHVDAPAWLSSPKREQRWATLLSGMAYCTGLHDYQVPLGTALAKAGWSEVRFVRLLRATDDALAVELRRVAQYLASKSAAANWAEVADLLFWQTGERAEKVRLRVARRYYSARHAEERE